MRVSSGDLIRKFSQFCDMALREPVVITKNGRDRLVLISIDEYQHLRDVLDKSEHVSDAQTDLTPTVAGKKAEG